MTSISRGKEKENENSLVGCLYRLYKAESLTDLVLICGERRFKVHKAIVLVQADLFKKCLNDYSPQSVDVSVFCPEILELIIDYMYLGEADVPQDQLTDFLKMASQIQLQGLCDQTADSYPKTTLATDDEFPDRVRVVLPQETDNDDHDDDDDAPPSAEAGKVYVCNQCRQEYPDTTAVMEHLKDCRECRECNCPKCPYKLAKAKDPERALRVGFSVQTFPHPPLGR